MQIGFDVETLEYTLGLFLCYPLGMIMNMLPYGPIRHIFSFLLGAFLLQFTLGVQWIHHMITSLMVYVMFLVLPARRQRQLFQSLSCCTWYLVTCIVSTSTTWDTIWTLPACQMVLTQKLYMMAYNLYDG